MNGRRIDAIVDPFYYQPGEYGRWSGSWFGCTPNGHLGNLGADEVVEHADRTITVSPSIKVSGGMPHRELWHGYLEKGVWRPA
jgi:hypothetical protein